MFVFSLPVDELLGGELVKDELIVGDILVEGPDQPVPVGVAVDEAAFPSAGLIALRVGVAGNIHPVPGPSFAVVGRRHEVVDERRPGFPVGAGVIDEFLLLCKLRGQAEEIEMNAAVERGTIRLRRGGDSGILLCFPDKIVDRMPCIGGNLRRGDRLK